MKIIILLSLFLIVSCQETSLPMESSHIFRLSQENIFVKTSKLPQGKFTLSFAKDSLLFENQNDSLEFKTGSYIQIIVDSIDIFLPFQSYVLDDHKSIRIRQITHNSIFNIHIIPDSVFYNTFFTNRKRKPQYTFLNIDTREYNVTINEKTEKEGSITGGW